MNNEEQCKGCMLIYPKEQLSKNQGRCYFCASHRILLQQIGMSICGVFANIFLLVVLYNVYVNVSLLVACVSLAVITFNIASHIMMTMDNNSARKKMKQAILNTQMAATIAAMMAEAKKKEEADGAPKSADNHTELK